MGISAMGFTGENENGDQKMETYQDFWNWFMTKENDFYKIIKNRENVETGFFDLISSQLRRINEGFYFLAGMSDETTAELIITAEGEIKNIVFAEEIIACAPKLQHWKFTALKPEMNLDSGIQMDGNKFTTDNIHFYANEIEGYPDEIDITFVYDTINSYNKNSVVTGVCIFLDNFLGELNFATQIDTFNVIDKSEAISDLIPLA